MNVELWPHQTNAVEETIQAFNEGAKIVFLDAPTGSGKTIIGATIRERLGVKAAYVCTNKGLQDQFIADFPTANLLKGRSNYTPPDAAFGVTCGDCTDPKGDACMWCEDASSCPYLSARDRALSGELAVLNTSYLLTEANNVGRFSKLDLVIADEADELERALMGHVEFAVSERACEQMNVTPPKKGVHKPTIVQWLMETLPSAINARMTTITNDGHLDELSLQRAKASLVNMKRQCLWVGEQLADDPGNLGERWVRDDSKQNGLTLKAVRVDGHGTQHLWRHANKWLLMSGSFVSTGEMVRSLGIDVPWETVEVPMTFPVENRPIYIAPIADVTTKNGDDAIDRLAHGIREVCKQHGPNERVLVHTVSYRLAQELSVRLKKNVNRAVITYSTTAERDKAFKQYSRTAGAVLLAPSMSRGYDFKGDLARVVIVAKVPFPYLGDRQVSARMHGEGGDLWYRVQTVREILQMTGRGVRNKNDTCATYILDRQFVSNVWKNSKMLFPKWWRDAVDVSYDARPLMMKAA